MSAYGGVVAINQPIDDELGALLARQFIEVLLAPSFSPGALEALGQRAGIRLLALAGWPASAVKLEAKDVLGGVLLQERDEVDRDARRHDRRDHARATKAQWADLLLAWRVCRHVRSNAIVLVRDGATVGIGAGQMSRVDAVRIAVEKAQAAQPDLLAGASLASDAYFPFADGPQLAIDAGVTAMIQPGGSIRDGEVVAAAEQAGIAMVMTGRRTSVTDGARILALPRPRNLAQRSAALRGSRTDAARRLSRVEHVSSSPQS